MYKYNYLDIHIQMRSGDLFDVKTRGLMLIRGITVRHDST